MSRPAPHRVALPEREDTILLHPHFARWPVLLEENVRVTPGAATDANRDELLQLALGYTRGIFGVQSFSGAPACVVATGHQCMWHHCGIWAKNVAACRLAEATGGIAIHLVLDHDVRTSSLLLPGSGSDGGSGVREIRIEGSPGPVPIELRPAPERARIEAFTAAVCAATEAPVCREVWPQWRHGPSAPDGAFAGMADFITFMQGTLNFSLGLNPLYLPVSVLSESTAFTIFAVGLMSEARGFAAGYNEAIEQLEPAGVRTLRVRDESRTEMPLWLVLPDGRRESLWIESSRGGRIRIGTERQEMDSLSASSEFAMCDQLKAILSWHRCRLRPKAITLTLFARTVLADWFVHGVGAQGYEAVTDHLIARWFDRRVPHFGIATCTMRLAGAGVHQPAMPDAVSARKHTLRHMMHNPEKHLSPEQLHQDRIRRLVEEKSSLLTRLGSPAEDAARKKAMHARLRQINEGLFHCLADARVEPSDGAVRHKPPQGRPEQFDNREFFFGLFPAERLRRVAGAVSGNSEPGQPVVPTGPAADRSY